MLAFRPGSVPPALIPTILKYYDKDKNGVLSRSENPFSDEVFRRLDRNGNGQLSAAELGAFVRTPPDLEVAMTLGVTQEQCSVALVRTKKGGAHPLASGFKSGGGGSATLTIGNQTVQLATYSPRGVYAQSQRISTFSFPDNGKGYITDKDVVGPQFQAIRVLFDMMDRDADGKVTRAEFDAFFTLQRGFTSLPLTLMHSAQTPSLFQLLDANGDGRLSVREVRNAWKRLIAFEPDGKDYVTRAALMPQGAIRFGRTAQVYGVNPLAAYAQPAIRPSTRGPTWFRKFDRNGDGEVSRKGVSGAKEQFDRIDANHDDYISLEEAEVFDKLYRRSKPAHGK